MLLTNLHTIDINPFHEPPLTLLNQNIIRRILPFPHAPISSKRPILKTVGSLPLQPVTRILVLVPKLHSDLVVSEGEQFFSQDIVMFFLPFLREEFYDCIGALQESVPVSPYTVFCVCFGYGYWISTSHRVSMNGRVGLGGGV